MKNYLNRYLNNPDIFKEDEQKKVELKKKKVNYKKNDGLVEVVEKTILVEDGRQLLND